MARMTENMNLQQALYKRIKQAGKGIVDIKESSRVAEMREGDGGRWVGLRIGENHWVRGSLVVSPIHCTHDDIIRTILSDDHSLTPCRLVQTDRIRQSDIIPRSRLMDTPTPPTLSLRHYIIPPHPFTPTIPPSSDSYLRAHWLSYP